MGQKKYTKEDFLIRAKSIHGNKYDYSRVSYIDRSTKVEIYCPRHNKSYFIAPSTHLKGYRLRCCSTEDAPKRKPKSTEQFINDARKVHGDEFDYSEIDYKGANYRINLVCKIHGPFSVVAGSHINNPSGCPTCGEIRRVQKRSDTTEIFIEKAKVIHGDKYDYSKVNYISRFVKIIIICKKCGEWEQTPSNHLSGYNCPNCSKSNWGFIDNNIFISRSNEVHNNFYDYSLLEYRSSHEKVKIVCPIHGEFEQIAYHHLQGAGCQKCCRSHGEREIAKFLECYGIEYEEQYRFEDCKNIYPLSFDFFIRFGNKRIVIEYQGEQHFYPVDFGSTGDVSQVFEDIKTRDKIKRKYCHNNNIFLLEIPYWELFNIKENIITGIINATTER